MPFKFTPINLRIKEVVLESKCTNGLDRTSNPLIKPETSEATRSGWSCAILLGTSSPKSIVASVISVTTVAVASKGDKVALNPQLVNAFVKRSLNAASPTIPLSTPMEVIPICIVDKNSVGLPINSSAVLAPFDELFPASCIAFKRTFLLAAKAISDIANMPFIRISKIMIKKSIVFQNKN